MEETEFPPLYEKFRQGDILKLHGASHADYGMIVNADCDLENDKNDDHIAYIPIFTFKDFISRYWYQDEVKNIRKTCEEQLARILKSQKEVSELIDWLHQDTPKNIIQELQKTLNLKKNENEDLEKNIKKLHACMHRNGLNSLKAIYSLEKNPEKHTETQLTKLKNSLGEGHMMISCISGLPEIGFILRMKRIFSIEQKYCFTSKSEYLLNSDSNAIAAVRIARLTTTYKYKAAQIFANSFSRIGLSDELTKLNQLAVLEIAQNIKEEENV